MTRRPIDPGNAPGRRAPACAGDELAIGELIERHQADLRLYCYLMLGCPVKAAAAVRETVAQARHGLPDAAAAPSERTWLYRIATRACVQRLEPKR